MPAPYTKIPAALQCNPAQPLYLAIARPRLTFQRFWEVNREREEFGKDGICDMVVACCRQLEIGNPAHHCRAAVQGMIMMNLLGQFLCAAILIATLAASPVCSEIISSGPLNQKGPVFALDINQDGSSDFVTWTFSYGSSQTGYDAVINSAMRYLNKGMALAPDGFPGAKCPLAFGETIGPTPPQGLLWSGFSNDAMLWTTWNMSYEPFAVYSGEWHDAHDRYLGFELRVRTEVFYGWIQLGVDAFNNVTLFGYAYENTPSTPIAAGAVPGAGTLFIRPDGGTASQCTGKVEAPYPGTGLHQPCAW